MRKKRHSIVFRVHKMYYYKLFGETPLEKFLFVHSQRSNVWRWVAFAGFSFYLGHIAYYINYKINVLEPAMV